MDRWVQIGYTRRTSPNGTDGCVHANASLSRSPRPHGPWLNSEVVPEYGREEAGSADGEMTYPIARNVAPQPRRSFATTADLQLVQNVVHVIFYRGRFDPQ